jgi:hypothetical protein
MISNGEDTMTRSHYDITESMAVTEAAGTAIRKKLPQYLPVVREPPLEIRELLARLVALDSVKRRAAELPGRVITPPIAAVATAATRLSRTLCAMSSVQDSCRLQNGHSLVNRSANEAFISAC